MTTAVTTDVTALTSALNLIADAANDTIAAATAGTTAAQKVMDFENLLPDLMALIPQIGNIPAEAKALQSADYITLVESFVTRLGVTNTHAEAIIAASLKLLTDIVNVIIPDVQGLVAAIKA